MKHYHCVIAAIDIYSEYYQVLQRALCVVSHPSELSLIFVTLPATHFQPYISCVDGKYVANIQLQAKIRLTQLAKKWGIPDTNIYSPVGNVATEIKKLAKDIGADLIVMGARGNSDLSVVLSTTALALLHDVKQDVLTVRSDDDKLLA